MPNLQLAGVAVAALLGWLLLLQVAVWATRPADIEPGPESLDLGPEPPAVANLLAGGWRMTPDASSATLIDLAARGVLGFEQYGPDAERTVCRLREAPSGLTSYERRVYDRVSSLAEGGVVPAAALVRGDESWAKSWWRGFRKETIADARARGLTRDRWSKPTLTLLHAAALVPALLAGATVLTGRTTGKNGEPERPFVLALGAAFALWWVLAAVVRWFADQRDTPAGRVAAARWLGYRDHVARDESFGRLPPAAVAIWDRHLAYAAALGIAKTAVRVLPLGARSERLAWSAYGGSWHQIRVRYPRGLWGASPWRVGFRALAELLVGGAAGYFLLKLRPGLSGDLDGLRPGLSIWAWGIDIPLALAGLLLLFGVRNLLRALAEYPSRHPVDGEVVRLVARAVGDSEHRSYRYYAGIDDGRSAKTRAYLLSGVQYGSLDEGDEVRVVAGRYLGRVFDITVLKDEPPPPATEAVPRLPAEHRASTTAAPAFGGLAAAGMMGVVAGALGRGVQPTGDGTQAAGVGTQAVDGGGAGGTDPDPTALVTAADVAGVLGVPVTAQPVGPQGGPGFLHVRMCAYTPQGSGYPTMVVHVASGALAGRLMSTARTRGEPVPGLPDAYFSASARQATVVVVRGRTAVTIGSYGQNADRAVLQRLATAAAARLAALPASPVSQ
jgi:hypothetical protein